MSVINYIKESFFEFRHNVEFPKWDELQQSTIVVAIATVILAIFLFAVDSAFNELIQLVYRSLVQLKS